MQINVSQLLKETIGGTREYDIDEKVEIEGQSYDIKGKIKLLRTHRGILVTGELHTGLELECSRCLCDFEFPVRLNLQEEYIPTIDIISGLPVPAPEEPEIFLIDEHQVIDLNEAIRQHVVIATPMKPLCREDCAGLCVKCGHNLNQGDCHCVREEIDPRWSKLAKLKALNRRME